MLKAREEDIKDKVKKLESEDRLKRISSELLEEYDSTELVASLLQELVEANDEVEVQLTFEKPLARKSRNKGNQSRRGGKRNNKFDNKINDQKVISTRKKVKNKIVEIDKIKEKHLSKVVRLLIYKNSCYR